MTRQITLRSTPSVVDRRQLLFDTSDYSTRGGARLAEVAGGTTAECAAVCCCCPCGLVNLLVLAVYKVPAGLCRKAIRRKRRRKLMKMGLLPSQKCSCDEFEIHSTTMINALELVPENTEVIELDKEMFEKFYGGGFWRSSSRRHEIEM